MSDQLLSGKAPGYDEGQKIDPNSLPTETVYLTEKEKLEPSMFLRTLEAILISKNCGKNDDDGSFDEVLHGNIEELDDAIKYDITSVDNFWCSIGYSLLEKAAEAGLVNIVKVIQKYTDKSIIKALNRPYNPLLFACINMHTEVVKLLLEHGANPDLLGIDGNEEFMTCLQFACKEEALDMLELLLLYGADPNFHFYPECPPLVEACEYSRMGVVKILLEHGADANLSVRGFRMSLFCACENGHLDIASLLLEYGADINCVDNLCETPLIVAVRYRRLDKDLVQLLLERGADPTIADSDGLTALDYADGDSEIAQMMINAQLESILK